jgi:hypothetical protein
MALREGAEAMMAPERVMEDVTIVCGPLAESPSASQVRNEARGAASLRTEGFSEKIRRLGAGKVLLARDQIAVTYRKPTP